MKEPHTIEIFSAGCPLCRHVIEDIQIGKCQGCNQIVYDVNNMTDDVKRKMKEYGITSVPTTIIDGRIKFIGIPDFPWICGDQLYQKLKREYPLGNKTNY
jgi:glutaredoxin 3